MYKNNKRGFTLIELLVVIAIIGMLSSVVLASLNSARKKARDTRRKQDIYEIQKALALYYDANGRYPNSAGASPAGTTPNTSWFNSAQDSSWSVLATALSPYIKTLPKDPIENNNASEWASTGLHYSYYAGGSDGGCVGGQYYMILYHLDNIAGPESGFPYCDGRAATSYYGTSNGANTDVRVVWVK